MPGSSYSLAVLTSILLFSCTLPTSEGLAKRPDFVGFSYSKADVINPASRRFISFINEVSIHHQLEERIGFYDRFEIYFELDKSANYMS